MLQFQVPDLQYAFSFSFSFSLRERAGGQTGVSAAFGSAAAGKSKRPCLGLAPFFLQGVGAKSRFCGAAEMVRGRSATIRTTLLGLRQIASQLHISPPPSAIVAEVSRHPDADHLHRPLVY